MPGKRASEAERHKQILRAALQVATRDRLDRLTIRSVAQEAGISPGLVLFHFQTKEALLRSLLAWLLRVALIAEIGQDIRELPTPAERLLALMQQELKQLHRMHSRLELFFDFWVLGSRDAEMRAMMRQAFDGYRAAFMPLAAEVIAAAPHRYINTTPEGLATLVVSVIQGCAVQIIKDPHHLNVEPMVATIYQLLAPPVLSLP